MTDMPGLTVETLHDDYRQCLRDVFDVPTLIEFVSGIMTLLPGDVIATGTPSGVGPLVAGDRVEVEVQGIGVLANEVADREDRGA